MSGRGAPDGDRVTACRRWFRRDASRLETRFPVYAAAPGYAWR